MIRILFVCLLLIYYWYFYMSGSNRIPKPTVGSPSDPPKHNFEFSSNEPHHFRFAMNNQVWEHTLPPDTFVFHKDKIISTDPCHNVKDGSLVPARGQILYEYLKTNQEIKNALNFRENDQQLTTHRGGIFYFKCLKGRVDKLEMCPSGTIFVNNACQSVNSCTNKPDGTLLPHRFASKYIFCSGGVEQVKNCPDETIFYHDRCESIKTLNHYCKHFNTSFLLNDETRIDCQNGKPVYVKCNPGTKFINHDICEPSVCVGMPDGTKIPLPERKTNPFKYIPGYMTCRGNKIHETVECPQFWDESLSKGDNLLSLPMVFDTKSNACSIPSYCENVFSDDPDIIVPVHEFTKKVKNWKLAKLFDHAEGFTCENNVRKRKQIPYDMRISKRFKAEPACGPEMPELLPLFGNIWNYFDCRSKTLVRCPSGEFFNGSRCVPEVLNAFKYYDIPLFQFAPMNHESWIQPWDYSKQEPVTCARPESEYIELYNICSHPDCTDYAFLSTIPDMAILLPNKAKCKFNESERTLKKEPVDFDYHFWTQKVKHFENEPEKPCVVGQNLETGNFIWDRTIFATCDANQPFVFCPSIHTNKIIPMPGGFYACEPPRSKRYKLENTDEWVHFETNEIKHISMAFPNTTVRKNKGDQIHEIPYDGMEVSENERINLFASKPIYIDPRFRVTHPPNVAFEYDENGKEIVHTSTPNRGFLVKLKNFTDKSLTFPRYIPVPFVESFDHLLYI